MNKYISINNVGLALLLSLYIISGINKINNYCNISIDLKNKFETKFPVNFPLNFYKFTMILVILLLTIGSLLLMLFKNTNIKNNNILILKFLFVSFTILATYLYHIPATGHNYYAVLKNISIIGGFLLI